MIHQWEWQIGLLKTKPVGPRASRQAVSAAVKWTPCNRAGHSTMKELCAVRACVFLVPYTNRPHDDEHVI